MSCGKLHLLVVLLLVLVMQLSLVYGILMLVCLASLLNAAPAYTSTTNAGVVAKISLLQSKSTGRVVYGEVPAEFVEYWCLLLQRPLGTVVLRASKALADTAVGHLHSSLSDVQDSSFTVSKSSFLGSPESSTHSSSRGMNQYGHATTRIVAKTVRFIVTDQFQILEQSTIRSIELITAAGISSLADLTSSTVSVTDAQMILLVSRVLANSPTVLNDVFGPAK
jgi:hypothetical protein